MTNVRFRRTDTNSLYANRELNNEQIERLRNGLHILLSGISFIVGDIRYNNGQLTCYITSSPRQLEHEYGSMDMTEYIDEIENRMRDRNITRLEDRVR